MNEKLKITRTMFSLSIAAYTGIVVLPDTCQALENSCGKMIDELLSNSHFPPAADGKPWKRVWGPEVYSFANDCPGHNKESKVIVDNLAYIASNSTGDEIVVGIMGTNPVSTYGWLMEDFDVGNIIPWKEVSGADSPGTISVGSYRGFDIVRKMKDPNAGTRIIDFLTNHLSERTEPCDIYITGHSLGAAITVTLGAYLQDTRSVWDKKKNGNLHIYPFAGITVGDEGFKKHVEGLSGPDFDFPNRYWNEYDVVPHLWKDIEMIPDLYKSECLPTYTVFSMIAFGKALSQNTGYIHVREESESLNSNISILGLIAEEIAEGLEKFAWSVMKTPLIWLTEEVHKLIPGIEPDIFMEKINTHAFLFRANWEHVVTYFVLLDAYGTLFATLDVVCKYVEQLFFRTLNAIPEIPLKLSPGLKEDFGLRLKKEITDKLKELKKI